MFQLNAGRYLSLRRLAPLLAVLMGASVIQSLPSPASAQFRVGGHGVYQRGLVGGTFGVGGRGEIDLGFVFEGLLVAGTYDRFFPNCETCSLGEVGTELGVTRGPTYVGIGASFRRFQAEEGGPTKDWDGNFVFGIRFPSVPVVTPFVQYRLELHSETINDQTFSAGFLVGPPRLRRRPGTSAGR